MVNFATKAETLSSLGGGVGRKSIKTAKILPCVIFTVYEWKNKKESVLKKIINKGFSDIEVIVRSSSFDEDLNNSSNAGKYNSILNVNGLKNISKAIDEVINSYMLSDVDFTNSNIKNQVFIQPMLKNVTISGVAFSIDPNTGGNYIIINYDDSTGLTNTVTSGDSLNIKTFYCFRNRHVKSNINLQKIVDLVFELENIFETNKLDIEFAIANNEVYLLQVRPLITNCKIKDIHIQEKSLSQIYNKIKLSEGNKPYICGKQTIFGVMPDWNPAEMIGIKPKPLALSLYKDLITDSIWAYQRDNYGYKNLRGFPLLINFSGLPYIDVRVSFNSFLPKDLSNNICEKLINYYMDRFIEKPENHDKIEFEIVHSCYTFNLNKKLNILYNYDFNSSEINCISNSLRNLTNHIIGKNNGLLAKDINKISQLEIRRNKILNSDLDIISKMYWLLEDCRRYGTLPFAGIARSAFIAVAMLKSLVDINIISESEYQTYMGSLNTISSIMQKDFNSMDKKDFLNKYGHLRPSTYDILSFRYDEKPDIYFDWERKKDIVDKYNNKSNLFKLSLNQLKSIEKLLFENNINCSILDLFEFFKVSIEGREYTKFMFTKSLSDILVLFYKLGLNYGFNREDMSFANINVIRKLYNTDGDIKQVLYSSIEEGKLNYEITKGINLPAVIINANDVFNFHQLQCIPNYITSKKVSGKNICIDVDDVILKENNIDNCIVCIKSADPGYDWIFSRKIKGLVTMYGGANSHMAIRAGEMGIPAIIGVGKEIYNRLEKGNFIEINCLEKTIKIWN